MVAQFSVGIGGWGTKEEVTRGGALGGRLKAAARVVGVGGVRVCVARL
jgi:hypothetical protein